MAWLPFSSRFDSIFSLSPSLFPLFKHGYECLSLSITFTSVTRPGVPRLPTPKLLQTLPGNYSDSSATSLLLALSARFIMLQAMGQLR